VQPEQEILILQTSRVRIQSTRVELVPCPACSHKQSGTNKECEACGIVFSKYIGYSPVKTQMNRFMPSSEIADVRRTQERFTKIKHDVASKTELLIHCHKEKLLDLAAYHLKQDNDKTGMSIIRKLISGAYSEQEQTRFSRLASAVSRPSVMIPAVLLILLAVMTLILRNSIY
jgi:hypothetical protein